MMSSFHGSARTVGDNKSLSIAKDQLLDGCARVTVVFLAKNDPYTVSAIALSLISINDNTSTST